MAHVDWSIKGPEIATCNCDWGCPCQFNALPTQRQLPRRRGDPHR